MKKFIETVFSREKKPIQSLSFIFCSDEDLLAINQHYLNHDYFTDIISFDLSDKNGSLVGEIYISVERVRENAKYLKEPFQVELHRVIFHGVLHLCGLNDKTSRQTEVMRKREFQLLQSYNRKLEKGST